MLNVLRLRWRTLLWVASTFLSYQSVAQSPAGVVRSYPEHHSGFRCAFDSVQQAAFARQPGAAQAYQAFMQAVAQLPPAALARLQATPDVTVPVVMHIIHTGNADNITDAQVYDAVRIVNQDFSKTNPDTADVLASFQSLYANIGFRFRLARLDPNGNCTTGITRTYSTTTNIGDDRVKDLIKWDQNKYLNIWICNSANGAGGYAYLPCSGGSNDGIVIRNAQFGSIGTSGSSNHAARSLTHEIGHYFGLPHTWGGSNTPGLSSNCGLDDGIADTPNTIGAQSSCSSAYGAGTVLTSFNPCGPLANVQNYMDYSSCSRMFTLGQRAVMRAALQLGCRQQLATTANLLATGTNDAFNGGPCAAVVAFQASAAVVCEGSSVRFTDYSYNVDFTGAGTTYAWQFPGGVPATSSLRNPTITYPTGGIYSATLTVTSAGGSSSGTRTNVVQVAGGPGGLAAPVAESFENPDFPNNYTAPDLRNWSQSSTSASGAARWLRMANSPGALLASDGQACLMVRSSFLPAGTQTSLISPSINLSTYTAANPPVLVFDRAYAIRPTPVNEYLSVQFSNDCGLSWTNQRNFFGPDLNTQDTARVYGFAPTAPADWKPLQLAIPASYLTGSFQVRFRMVSGGGNSIYLDNVRLVPATVLASRTGGATAPLQVYPNPLTAETVVQFNLATPGPIELRLTDLLGRQVGSSTVAVGRTGAQTLPLLAPGTPAPAPGVYLVELRSTSVRWTSKVLIR